MQYVAVFFWLEKSEGPHIGEVKGALNSVGYANGVVLKTAQLKGKAIEKPVFGACWKECVSEVFGLAD